MILTVTLNPALDKNFHIADFALRGVYRVENGITTPGGKGINVSRVLAQLGTATRATGILGGYIGKLIEAQLNQEGIVTDFVRIKEESRLSILVMDSERNTHTEIIEPGPHIPKGAYDKLNNKLRTLAPDCDWIVFSGSPPPNAPADIYCRFIETAKTGGAKVLLDARGPWLREGIKAKPDLIKPNWEEFLELVGPCHSTVQAVKAARGIVVRGVGGVIVSMGDKGAVAVYNGQAYFSRSLPAVEVLSPVGGGDTLVAGLVAKLNSGWDFPAALRFGLAVATASTTQLGAGEFDLNLAEQLARKISVDKTPY